MASPGTVRSDEGCLQLVPLSGAHQIVSNAQVQFRKDAGLRERVECCLEPKEGVAVLNCDLVQTLISRSRDKAPFFIHNKK